MSSRTGPAGLTVRLVAAASAAVLAAALGGCGSSSGTAPGTTSPAPTAVTSSAPLTSPTTSPASPGSPSRPAGTATGTTSAPAVPALRAGALPLWPFGTATQVLAWQRAYRANGSQPWHRSAEQTAVAFAHTYLGYTEVDRATSTTGSATDVRVGVGWADPNGRDATAGVVHLLRFGTGADAPWEVVGTRDSILTLTSPRYGSTVGPTLLVGGRISGVDESLVVQVRSLAGEEVLAESAPLPAGGEDTPWSTRLTVDAPSGTVLTVSVSTGGHLMDVEAFAVTGVRVR